MYGRNDITKKPAIQGAWFDVYGIWIYVGVFLCKYIVAADMLMGF